jgi:hypothetical protein
VKYILSIDTRALGVFRILIGATLLVDIAIRLVDVRAFYTDSGVLPRSLHRELFPLLSSLSIHGISGSVLFQIAMFGVASVFAFTLMIGYRTTTSTVASFVLLFSVQARNPLTMMSGDATLLVLLFFSTLLPLGARYSVDANQHGRECGKIIGVETALPLLYMTFLIYAVNGITRFRGETWMSGEGVWRIYGLDAFTVFLGDFFAPHYGFLFALNWVWVGMLVASPLLIILKRKMRTAFVLLFMCAHAGMLVTLYLDVFPLTYISALTLFLPPWFWNRAETYLPNDSLREGVFREMERVPSGTRISTPVGLLSLIRRVGLLLSATVFLLMLLWACIYLGYVQSEQTKLISENTMKADSPAIRYPWAVFSPEPLNTDGWYMAPVQTQEQVVYAYELSKNRPDEPPDFASNYPTSTWSAYLFHWELHSSGERLREGFARYLCIRADEHYEGSPERIEVYFMREPARYDEDQPQEANKREVISGSCERLTDKW